MELIEYLADYLINNENCPTKSIYKNTQPATEGDCITIVANGGAKALKFLGQPEIIKRPTVLCKVRNSSDEVATQWAEALLELLDEHKDVTADILGIWQLGEISNAGRDIFGRAEKSVQFRVFLLDKRVGGDLDA